MYVFIESNISHIILFSAIVSGRMDLAGCLLITCFILSFVHFLIHSPKTGLDLLQNSQLKWGCDSPGFFAQFPRGGEIGKWIVSGCRTE